MKRKIYHRGVILLTLFLSCLAGPGCDEQDPIALCLKPQSRYRQKVKLISKLHMLFPEIEVHKTSSTDQRRAKQKQKFRNVFSGFKGKRYHALVDPDGKVLKIFDMDARIEKITRGPIKDGSFGGYQLALLLSETNLREYVAPALSHGLTVDPDEPNRTLFCYSPIEVPWALPVMGKKTYTFDGIEKRNGQKIALLSLKIDEARDKQRPPYTSNCRAQHRPFRQ